MNSDWGFSSSSESDDDERPISKLRNDTEFYRGYYQGDYGCDWPNELQPKRRENLANSSILYQNDVANSSFANTSIANTSFVNTSFANISRIAPDDTATRIVSPKSILNKTPDDIVLVDEGGGRYRPVRVISKNEILSTRKEENYHVKIESAVNEQPPNQPREIPLEKIDFIDPPSDPRKRDLTFNDNHDFDGTDDVCLLLPQFYRQVMITSEMAKHKERSPAGFKPSISHIRQKIAQKLAPRVDPRLERNLFVGPPRKVVSPPNNNLNKSQPNMKNSSIFDFGDDSDDFTSPEFSSSDDSSIPIVHDDQISANESETDHSFVAFAKRKSTMKNKKPAAKRPKHNDAEQLVPPIKINLKKKQVTPTNTKKTKTLFGTPPTMEKDDILNALTEDTDQEEVKNSNKIKSVPVASTTKSPKKRKVKIRPSFKLPVMQSHQKNSSSSDTDGTRHITRATTASDIRKLNSLKKAKQNISTPKQLVISTSSEKENIQPLKTSETIDAINMSDKLSEKSTDSLEKRLAAMSSPVKEIPKACVEDCGQSLADMLSADDDANETENGRDVLPNENIKLPENQPKEVKLAEQMLAVDSGIQTATDSPQSEIDSELLNANEIDGSKVEQNGILPTVEDPSESAPEPNTVQMESMVETSISKDDTVTAKCERKTETSLEVVEISVNSDFNVDEAAKMIEQEILEHDLAGVFDLSSGSLQRPRIIVQDYLAYNVIPGLLLTEQMEDEEMVSEVITEQILDKVISEQVVKEVVAESVVNEDHNISDDDIEDDQPCGIDEITLPNSNANRNVVGKMQTNCGLCKFQAKSFKQLTMHYVRTHPDKEIATSRLANQFNPQELQETFFTPMITKNTSEIMIHTLCYICGEGYNMSSSKWLSHFIAHTGEFEFQCNGCNKKILQDLHKKCTSTGNQRINGPFDFVDNTLFGYVCALCNYVQLTKKNITSHLENEHHQLITDDQNVIEIVLLKTSQSLDFLVDDKNDRELVAAKERVSEVHQPNRYENCSPLIISEDELELDHEPQPVKVVDLTLSDDDDI